MSIKNTALVCERLYGNDLRDKKIKVDVKEGDLVRISKMKGQFEKGYLPNWSREEFLLIRSTPNFYHQWLH